MAQKDLRSNFLERAKSSQNFLKNFVSSFQGKLEFAKQI